MFPPFRAEDYRQEVHAQIYACLAKNQIGSAISRDVHVRAGMLQKSPISRFFLLQFVECYSFIVEDMDYMDTIKESMQLTIETKKPPKS